MVLVVGLGVVDAVPSRLGANVTVTASIVEWEAWLARPPMPRHNLELVG